MNTQSIIVYRNPLEQQLWEGLMSGEFIPIITGFIVFFILYTAIYNFIIDKYYRWSKRRTPIKFALAISLITGVITTWALLKI